MNKKQNWMFLFLLTIFIVIVRLPGLDEPLDNDSGANAFFSRQMLRGEILYDKYHPTHHLPGIYYTFVAAFKLFGDTPIAPKLFLLPWMLLCAWLVYRMGQLYLNDLSGILGAVFFILVSSQVSMKGTTAEMEQFANLPLTAGVFLSISLLRSRAQAWKYIWVGLIGAICMLYKVTFIAPLAVVGLAIFAMAWMERGKITFLKTVLPPLAWMFIGFVIPVAAVGYYFASLGLWERFILVFRIGFAYVQTSNSMFPYLPPPFGFPLVWMAVSNVALLMFGLIGVYRCARHSFPFHGIEPLTNFMLSLWFVISFAEAGLRGGGWEHYALLVVPPLSLMGAYEISVAYKRWKIQGSEKKARIGASIMTALIVLIFVVLDYDFYSHYVAYKLGSISRDDFILGYTGTSGTGPHALNAEKIGYYIQAHTTPDDLIYLATPYVQSYYYADRNPPVDMIWPVYLFVTGSGERIFDPRVQYIVFDPEKEGRPRWLIDGLKRYFYLETMFGDQEIYHRISQ